MNQKERLCLRLAEIGAIKFGLFTLKSGLKSPIYIDLRVLVSFPTTLNEVALALKELALPLSFDRLAGIPYSGLTLAVALSLVSNKPLIYSRKETKDYGTKKKIEGLFNEGETVLVVDDLITTGESKFEAVEVFKEAGLKVKDIVVLIDREQGGKEQLKKKGISLHSFLTVTEYLEILRKHNKLSEQEFKETSAYFKDPEKWQEGH
jgi:uridine monophosphate synthetase